jgi:hypothetical protein
MTATETCTSYFRQIPTFGGTPQLIATFVAGADLMAASADRAGDVVGLVPEKGVWSSRGR